ncbi:hypothetical protein ACOJUR_14000 [Alicyclobacillus tolerans]|uniref:hypothetical protein n=1 Tax=Alicyclobacillus tolerans TaxID=90970 RepID=UPI003B817C4E
MDSQSFIDSFVSPNNNTGLTMSVSDVENADSINAAAGAWYLKGNMGGSTVNWQNLSLALNQYNEGPNDYMGNGYNNAYGLSVLFKAYGINYQNVPSVNYDGPYVATSPSGTQPRYNNASSGDWSYGPILTPSFTVESGLNYIPFGTNSQNRRVVILVGDDEDYVNGLFIQQWLYDSPSFVQAYLTRDAQIAVHSANLGVNGQWCVVAMGGAAVSNLQSTASNDGVNLTEFTSFSAWESSHNIGYIDCSGATYADNYDKGLTTVQQAANAGWL